MRGAAARWSLLRRMRAPGGVAGLALGAAAACVLVAAPALGKSTSGSPYGFERTWNAALRMVRVDLGFKVLEKDDATGYLLFEYRSSEGGPKPSTGSFEIIRPSGKSDEVRVVVQLPQMPRYHEQVLLDRLARKMRDEYGEPPDPARRGPSAADAGADAGDDSDNN